MSDPNISGWFNRQSHTLRCVMGLYLCAFSCRFCVGEVPPAPAVEDYATPHQSITNGPDQSSVIPVLQLSDSESGIRVEPYGSLWGSSYYATSRTEPGVFTLWVLSEEEEGESTFEVDVRRSQIGARIFGPEIEVGGEYFKSRARVELDFYGQFLTENRAGVRLRHAYWESESDMSRYLIGQTDDVISPLLPGTLNFVVGRSAGNLGFRRAQFRIEKYLNWRENTELIVQGSLNQDIVADFPTESGIRRESANWPVLQARIAGRWSPAGDESKTLTVGLSGHVGETGFDFLTEGPPPLSLPPQDDVRIKTWSINLDAEIPLTETVTLRGEWFRGANLSPFLGGIGQGACPCLRRPIHSDGGWVELKKQLSPRWETHCGAGIDDPEDEDSLLGRTQNSFIFGNLIFHVSKELSTGCEVTWWKTLYHETRTGIIPPEELTPSSPGEAITLEWMVRYDF